jgi:very-short-patch-repair endonuclease
VDRGGGILALADHPPTIEQGRWVGLLAGGEGAVLGFEGAGDLHRIEGAPRGRIVVIVDHPLHLVVPGVTFHQLGDVRPHHRLVVGGYPTTTPARTIIDLAAVISWVRLRSAIEDVVVRRLATYGQIADVLREVRRRGKPGVRKLVVVLDGLGGEPPPSSELERLLYDAGRAARVNLLRQHPLPSRGHIKGIVDAVILESKLILEADGRSWHARYQAMAKDRQREREAARLGWQTIRFIYEDLMNDLAGCVDDIRVVHGERLALLRR